MKINGKEITIEKNTTLDALIKQQGYDIGKIAVMKNGDIVPKTEYPSTQINNDDSLEVVSFVGGG
ncbi:MAG: sulfur carrier protein ThiS [Clostridium sp.]|nr:sulfur carrier protein ThiS [Clostridium sp.]MCM1548232.1 sulfur carrier protein ThiS [Ruminococcus sp.]